MQYSFFKYPHVEQYSNIVSAVKRRYEYTGIDSEGNPTYNGELPIITFTGTVKCHGTNAGVSFSKVSGMQFQSRERVVTIEDDNAGFANFCMERREALESIIQELALKNNINLRERSIVLFGEFIGKGIQKKVAVSKMERSLFLFDARVSDVSEDASVWLDISDCRNIESRIYNVYDYPTYKAVIDFNNPTDFSLLTSLSDLVDGVSQTCPIGSIFGVEGCGEGVVFTAKHDGVWYRMKIKGEDHKVTRTDRLVDIDPVKVESIEKFLDAVCTENRLEQAIEISFGLNERPEISGMGKTLQWFVADVIREEAEVIEASGLDVKEVKKSIPGRVKHMFMAKLNSF